MLGGRIGQDLDREKKRVLADLLKWYANETEAHLVFCSKSDRANLKVAKDLLTSLAFATKFKSGHVIYHHL